MKTKPTLLTVLRTLLVAVTVAISSMRAFLPIFAVFAAALFSTEAAWGQGTDRYTKMANQLVELINAGDYAGIQTNFNKQMDAALPLDKSSAFFKGLTQQVGKIQKLGEPQSVGGWMVFPAKFERGTLDMQIALDGRDQIAGLMFKPHAATKPVPEKHQAELSQADRYTKMANQLKELVNAGDYAGIQTKFNEEMGAALPLDKSSEFFKGLTQQMGTPPLVSAPTNWVNVRGIVRSGSPLWMVCEPCDLNFRGQPLIEQDARVPDCSGLA